MGPALRQHHYSSPGPVLLHRAMRLRDLLQLECLSNGYGQRPGFDLANDLPQRCS